MTIKASAIMASAQQLVRDIKGVVYTQDQALDWINDGHGDIVHFRRDAGAYTRSAIMVAGAKQALAAGEIQLIGDLRMMGTDGTTEGAAVIITERSALDAINPEWSVAANRATVVSEYMYNPNNPTIYYVNPPSDGTGYLEATVARTPAPLTDIEDNINIGDQWKMALVYFVLWNWMGRDDERSPNYTRAQAFKSSYFQSLGASVEAKAAALPEK